LRFEPDHMLTEQAFEQRYRKQSRAPKLDPSPPSPRVWLASKQVELGSSTGDRLRW